MSELQIIDSDAFEQMEKVADLMMQGKSEFAIARALHIKVVDAKHFMSQWQAVWRDEAESKDMAREHLDKMVKHYDRLIEESHKNLNDLKALTFGERVSAQINATLKNIADFEAKRVALLREAGLLDGADLGDELAERERREQQIIQILRTDLCPKCQAVVRDKLSELTGKVEGTVVSVVQE